MRPEVEGVARQHGPQTRPIFLVEDVPLAVRHADLADLDENAGVELHDFLVGNPIEIEVVEDFFLLLDQHVKRRRLLNAVEGGAAIVERHRGRSADGFVVA